MPSATPYAPRAAAEPARRLEELPRLERAALEVRLDGRRRVVRLRALQRLAAGERRAWRRRARSRPPASPSPRARRRRARTDSRRPPARRPRRGPTRRPPCRGGSGRGRSGRRGRASPCGRARPRRPPRATARARAASTRKTSSGRSRLPPAASASSPTAATSPDGSRPTAREPLLERVQVASRPGGLADRGERAHASLRASPTCKRDDTARRSSAEPHVGEAGPLEQRGERRRAPGSGARSPAGTCRPRRPGSTLPSAGTTRSNQSAVEGREPAARRVISRIAEPAARAQHAAQLAQRRARGRRRCGCRSRPSRRRTTRPRTAARARRPRTHSIVAAPCAARAFEHRAPRSRGRRRRRAARARGDREIAGAAAGVEHAVARATASRP